MKYQTTDVFDANGLFIGSVLTIPAALYLPDLYYCIEAGTHNTTEFYLTQHEAESALQEQRWSIETRRARKETAVWVG